MRRCAAGCDPPSGEFEGPAGQTDSQASSTHRCAVAVVVLLQLWCCCSCGAVGCGRCLVADCGFGVFTLDDIVSLKVQILLHFSVK